MDSRTTTDRDFWLMQRRGHLTIVRSIEERLGIKDDLLIAAGAVLRDNPIEAHPASCTCCYCKLSEVIRRR